jgi:trehalose 6-phosphate synthase/phosphatase
MVNPYDVAEFADSIHHALGMTDEERRRRMLGLRRKVLSYDVHWWSNQFLAALRE